MTEYLLTEHLLAGDPRPPLDGEGSLALLWIPFGDDLRTRTWRVRAIRAFVFDLDDTLVETEELKAHSVWHRHGGGSRRELGYPGAGPTVIMTDLGVFRQNLETKELAPRALHPGAPVEQAKEARGWDLRAAENLPVTDPPAREEQRVLRDLHARTEAARKGAAL